MRKPGVAAAVAALALLSAALAAGSPSRAEEITPAAALADLNAMRAKAGLKPVEAFLPAWNEGCRLHDLYMKNENDLTHEESRSSRWWTAAGAAAGESSQLAGAELLPSEAWGDTAYHRGGLLRPRLRFAGFYAGYGYTCLRDDGDEKTSATDGSRRTSALTAYPWPAANAREVPLTFDGGEEPDPMDEAPAGTKQLGYPLTVAFNGPWADAPGSVYVTRATLTTGDGTTVPLTISDGNGPQADGYDSAFGLFPNQALAPGTTYTVHALGVVSVGFDASDTRRFRFDYSWSFTTERVAPTLRVRGAGGTVSVLSNANTAVVVRAQRNGTTATLTRQLAHPGTVILPLTRGTWKICATQQPAAGWLGVRVCVTRVVSG